MVLVCNDPKFVFLKTRKTAGTSIEMALEPLCVPPGTEIVEFHPTLVSSFGIVGRRGEKLKGWQKPLRFVEWSNHRSARFVRTRLGRRRWDDSLKITAVRNPFDRMISYFHYKFRGTVDETTPEDDIRTRFRAFILGDDWKDDREITHLGSHFIIDEAIRFETMQADLARLKDRLGVSLELTLPMTKPSGKSRKKLDVPEYYDAETADHVRRRLDWVFRHYGYPDTPQPRRTAPRDVRQTA